MRRLVVLSCATEGSMLSADYTDYADFLLNHLKENLCNLRNLWTKTALEI